MIEKPPKKRIDDKTLKILDGTMTEFGTTGEVLNARCDVCGSLLKIKELSETAWAVECQCGKFKDNLRGI